MWGRWGVQWSELRVLYSWVVSFLVLTERERVVEIVAKCPMTVFCAAPMRHAVFTLCGNSCLGRLRGTGASWSLFVWRQWLAERETGDRALMAFCFCMWLSHMFVLLTTSCFCWEGLGLVVSLAAAFCC